MTIISAIQCDETSCKKIIPTDSVDHISIVGKEYLINIGSKFSTKQSRLDFCNKVCFKKYIDEVDKTAVEGGE